jgi:hypothetical protein
MTLEEFDACFDQFYRDVFRLEALQAYAVDEEDASYSAWRAGQARPECSVRTDPWMRRIAVTTAAGKHWSRVHVVDEPLSDYLRYELVGYVESAAVGEEIRITPRQRHSGLTALREDFWLFDGGDPAQAFAVLMRYDDAGHWLGADRSTRPDVLDRCRAQCELALQASVPLNEYLATLGREVKQVA